MSAKKAPAVAFENSYGNDERAASYARLEFAGAYYLAYRDLFVRAGLELIEAYRPLEAVEEPYLWVNETTIAPWVIYVLARR